MDRFPDEKDQGPEGRPQATREELEFRPRVLDGRAPSSHVFAHYIILASAGNGDGGAMGVTPEGGGL